jgi:pimeloyl-ACP methyl ester carboxylesterase
MLLAAKLLIFLGFLLVAAVSATLWKARTNERLAEVHYPPEGQFLEIDGHRVHALVRGAGPDLVLIHGSSGSVRDFSFDLVDRLADHFRVIVIDRPGLGYTDRINDSGATIFQQADLLRRAAAQLGAERPIVLGQSYGGSVALAWAARHPDDIAALVTLAAPALPWDTPLSRYYQITSHPLLGPLVIPLLTAWISESRVASEVESVFAPQTAPKGYAAHFGPGLTLRRKSLRANAMQRANLLDEIRALEPELSQITTPTEILHGDIDVTVSQDIHARPLSRIVSNAQLTILPGIGHMPHHAATDDVIAAIHRAATRATLH